MTTKPKSSLKDKEQDKIIDALSKNYQAIEDSLKELHSKQEEHALKQDSDNKIITDILGDVHRGMWGEEKNGHDGVVKRSLNNKGLLKEHDLMLKKGIWWFGGFFIALEFIGMVVMYFVFER